MACAAVEFRRVDIAAVPAVTARNRRRSMAERPRGDAAGAEVWDDLQDSAPDSEA